MGACILGFLVCLLVLGGTSVLFLKDDNPIEEACEEVIKDITGIEIDITPHSQEPKEEETNDIIRQ